MTGVVVVLIAFLVGVLSLLLYGALLYALVELFSIVFDLWRKRRA